MRTLIPFFVLFASCSNLVVSQKSDKQQIEFNVQKLKTEIEDLKMEMKTFQIEVGILEGKLMYHEEDLSYLQAQDNPAKGGRGSLDQSTLIDKRIQEVEKTLDTLMKRFDRIEVESKEIAKSIFGYRQKFGEIEKYLQTQNDSLQEIAKVRKSLKEIKEESTETITYRVRPGDSLEKIARQFSTTPDQIKKMNQLHNDLILVGQELRVPK
ncbi:MAG: LysM peptidoglycan-binding domain-containing protein [Chlamydiia bacterium]